MAAAEASTVTLAKSTGTVIRPSTLDVAVPHTPGRWRLLYFDAPTRGEQIRVLFEVTGTAYDDVRLVFPAGLNAYKTDSMGDASPLLGTDLCPAVTAPDGTHCIETSDIMRFVGQRVGLAPAPGSPADAKAMETCLLAQDVLNEVFYPLLKQMVVKQIAATEILPIGWLPRLILGKESAYLAKPSARLPQLLEKADAALGASDGPYVCGDQLSYADVALFATLREVLAYKCFDEAALLATCPRYAALHADLAGRLKGYLDEPGGRASRQLGYSSTVAFLAATNTPFPWSRKSLPKQ